MKNLLISLSLYLFLYGQLSAQIVTTIAGPNSGINDALIVDSIGNIYGSDFNSSPLVSSSVYKIDTAGILTTFSTGYSACNGLAFDHNENLYVVDFSSPVTNSRIYKLDSLGVKTPYGPKIPGASGILFDPLSDTLYVSQYNGTTANQISKLAPDGTVTLHTNHSLLNGPVGMAFDSVNVLYVANFTDGEIYKISPQGDSLTLIANIPNVSFWGIGFMTYAAGYLFATGIGVHKIYKISLTGELTEFAGTGIAGSTDGAADIAQFSRPNGIATNYQQDRIYVSDLTTESVREITSSQLTGIEDQNSFPFQIASFSSFPNPATETTTLAYTLRQQSEVHLRLFSSEGRLIQQLLSERQNSGEHQFTLATESLPQGVYYGKLISGGYTEVILITVLH